MIRAPFFAFAASLALALGGGAVAAPKDKDKGVKTAPPKGGPAKGKKETAVGDDGEAPPEGVTRPNEGPRFDEISDGSRHLVKDGEISIIPPKRWEIFKRGVTFLAQAPLKANTRYQRNIQMTRFVGVRYIDEFSVNGTKTMIEDRFAKVSKQVSAYTIQSDEMITLGNGRPALLIKATFKLGDTQLGHAHVVVSDAARHYVITYTDLATNFGTPDKIGANLLGFLATVKTVELKGPNPVRMGNIFMVSVGGGVLAFLGLSFLAFRYFRSTRKFEEMGEGKNLDLSEREERQDLIEANHQERVRVEVHMEEATVIAQTGMHKIAKDEDVEDFEPEEPVEIDDPLLKKEKVS